MRVTWHPQAEDEMVEAARVYNRRVAGLGADFLDAVDAAIDQITSDPKRFPRVEGDIQRCRVKRFPLLRVFSLLAGYGSNSCCEPSQSSSEPLETSSVNPSSDCHEPSGGKASPCVSPKSLTQPVGFIRGTKAAAAGFVHHVGVLRNSAVVICYRG